MVRQLSTEEAVEVVAAFEAQCAACRAGRYEECSIFWTTLEYCAPVELDLYLDAAEKVRIADATGKKAKADVSRETSEHDAVPAERPVYDSGYIDPGAWRFTKDIGDFTDPLSSGRKLAARLYPITAGTVCEWAGKVVLGLPGGELVGCAANAATDIHHGPDKNTLNNAKGSLGVGVNENVWILCSSCHNLAHALIDSHYPPYDRIADQTRPWIPLLDEDFPWGQIAFREATIDELLTEERRRLESEARRGRSKRGRHKDVVADLEAMLDDEDQ